MTNAGVTFVATGYYDTDPKKKGKRVIIVIVSLLASWARREWGYDWVITSYYVCTTELLQTSTGMYKFEHSLFVKRTVESYVSRSDNKKHLTAQWRWRFILFFFIAAADFLLTLCRASHASVSGSWAKPSHPSSTVTTRYLTDTC